MSELTTAPHDVYDPALDRLKTLKQSTADRSDVPDDVKAELDNILKLVQQRETYATGCVTAPSNLRRNQMEKTFSHPWLALSKRGETMSYHPPVMISGSIEAELLRHLVVTQKCTKVLDIGMYTGYSAISMAEVLPEGGSVTSLEIDPYLGKYVKESIAGTDVEGKIEVIIGPAICSLSTLEKRGDKFDFIFVDAKKSEYPDYLQLIMNGSLLSAEGTMAFDNALLFGCAYSDEDRPDYDDEGKHGIRGLNESVMKDPRLEQVLLPIRDGLLLVRQREVGSY